MMTTIQADGPPRWVGPALPAALGDLFTGLPVLVGAGCVLSCLVTAAMVAVVVVGTARHQGRGVLGCGDRSVGVGRAGRDGHLDRRVGGRAGRWPAHRVRDGRSRGRRGVVHRAAGAAVVGRLLRRVP